MNNKYLVTIALLMFLVTTSLLILGYYAMLWSKLLFWAIIVLGYWATIVYCLAIKAEKQNT
tara:strand:- start:42442 stop:42624 length:183 start_codon:yes stop_codon:yes gene_type:complete